MSRRTVELEQSVEALQKRVDELAELVAEMRRQRDWDKWAGNEKRSSAAERP